MPGLIDSHIHLIDGGLHLTSVQLRDADDARRVRPPHRRVRQDARSRARGSPAATGTTRCGAASCPIARLDRRRDAQQPGVDQPARRPHGARQHRGDAAAGVGDDVKDVAGGEIVRDAAGRPTGIFKDNAMALIDRAVPDATLAAAARRDRRRDGLSGRPRRDGRASHGHVAARRSVPRRPAARPAEDAHLRLHAAGRSGSGWPTKCRARGRGDEWLQDRRAEGLCRRLARFAHGGVPGAVHRRAERPRPVREHGRGPRSVDRRRPTAPGCRSSSTRSATGRFGCSSTCSSASPQQNGPRDRRFRIEHAQHIAPEDIPRFAQAGRHRQHAAVPLRSTTAAGPSA